MKACAFDNSIGKFLASLDKKTGPKVVRTIELLEEYGPKLGMPHSKRVRDGIFELRIRGIQEVRVFYIFQKDSVILLHGFIKKSQKTPKKELELALQRAKTLDKR